MTYTKSATDSDSVNLDPSPPATNKPLKVNLFIEYRPPSGHLDHGSACAARLRLSSYRSHDQQLGADFKRQRAA
jgi:hypothetical protein